MSIRIGVLNIPASEESLTATYNALPSEEMRGLSFANFFYSLLWDNTDRSLAQLEQEGDDTEIGIEVRSTPGIVGGD